MHSTAAEAIVAYAQFIAARGLGVGTSGNLSARCDGGFLITPSGVPYDDLTADKIVLVQEDGTSTGAFAPSSEWRFHFDIYASRPDAGAIMHCHSAYATALACLRRGIPAFHYMVAVAGGADIRCADYALFGTQKLSDAALAALEGRKACLLANHGQIAIANTVAAAFSLAQEVEELARQYSIALQVGEPVLLDAEEMADVVEKFKTYGMRTEP
jgi:L-fuculose-phosphate aldolase